MNVEQLKNLLDCFPDDYEVLVGGAEVRLVYTGIESKTLSLDDDADVADDLDPDLEEVLYPEDLRGED